MGRDVIIACDFAGKEATLNFLDLFKNEERKPFDFEKLQYDKVMQID